MKAETYSFHGRSSSLSFLIWFRPTSAVSLLKIFCRPLFPFKVGIEVGVRSEVYIKHDYFWCTRGNVCLLLQEHTGMKLPWALLITGRPTGYVIITVIHVKAVIRVALHAILLTNKTTQLLWFKLWKLKLSHLSHTLPQQQLASVSEV